MTPRASRRPAEGQGALTGYGLSATDIAVAIGRPEPTPEQVAVIEAPLAPLLVVAGAGSGKTETMAARVVWMVANGLTTPEQVLGLTFTRKAAGELAERVRRRLRRLTLKGVVPDLGESDGDADISTYHAYAGRLVREHALRLGIEPESRLLTEAATWQYASEVVESWVGDMSEVDKSPATMVNAVLRLAGECAEHLVTPAELSAHLAELADGIRSLPVASARGGLPRKVGDLLDAVLLRQRLVPMLEAYERRKRDREVLDFGDQLALAATLAQRFPEIGAAERMRSSVVLLDEFQDTSHAQMTMLWHLFGSGHPVTAVGDPHQSIYGWRGASADTLGRFLELFCAGDPAAERTLSTSWRNDDAILAAANVVAAPLRDLTRARGLLDVPPLVARPESGPGRVEIGRYLTRADEAAAIAGWVVATGAPYARTAAVLCRTRSQFVAVEDALRAAGVPVEVVGLGGLLSTPEVVDVVSALQAIADPDRGDAVMRLLSGSICRLGARDLMVLGRWSQVLRARAAAVPLETTEARSAPEQPETVDEASLVEALDSPPPVGWVDQSGLGLSPAAHQRLGWLSRVLRHLRGRASLPLAELVVEVVRALRLDIEVAARPGISPAGARTHLDAFEQVAVGFAETADQATLPAFLAWLAAAEQRERGLQPGQSDSGEIEVTEAEGAPSDVEVSRGAVQLLTVHAAKGLEWDVVAVPGLVEGILPIRTVTARHDGTDWVCGADSDGGWRTIAKGGVLPYGLRGDRDALPVLDLAGRADTKDLDGHLADFEAACGRAAVAEERRLAYVAFTRAKESLLLTAHVWGTPTRTPRVTSRFVEELLATPGGAPGVIALPDWAPMPEPADDLTNPAPPDRASAAWPADPLGERRAAVEAAADAVRAALAAGPDAESPWTAEIDLLLAERDRSRSQEIVVALPTHLSASRLVRLAEDPVALAGELRRPMPRPPAPEARRGTAFHAWIEQRYGAAAMVDILELPGSADEAPADDDLLPQLQANFLASEWAERTPREIEVAIETPVAGTVIRGRIDAVFPTDDGGWDVVDWKTGAEPRGAAATARAVQLAAYRLAWSRLVQVPVDQVGAAFFYAATGRTVRPVDLLDEAALVALVSGEADGRGSGAVSD